MSQLNSIPELTVTRTQTGESLTQPEVEPSDPHNSEDEEAQELEHFYAVVMAFRYYGYSSVQDLNLRKRYFDELTRSKPDQVRFLSKLYYAKLREVGRALQANAHFLGLVVEDHDIFHNDNRVGLKDLPLKVPPQDHMDKVATTLRMLVRDWSDRGAKEREIAYQPILEGLLNHFSHVPEAQRPEYKVSVPGAGLGRLAYEVAKLGFSCQGNEFSYFMLLASSFMLNKASAANQFTIFPYASAFSNHACIDDQLLPVQIPDIVPAGVRLKGDFSMSAGDFLEVYGSGHAGQWDAVVTCFFIDTAKNVADYIETIHAMLKPAGVWINFGPLLYHFESISGEPSLELTYEELKTFMQNVGFIIQDEKKVSTPYTADQNSMLVYTYNCVSFAATKS